MAAAAGDMPGAPLVLSSRGGGGARVRDAREVPRPLPLNKRARPRPAHGDSATVWSSASPIGRQAVAVLAARTLAAAQTLCVLLLDRRQGSGACGREASSTAGRAYLLAHLYAELCTLAHPHAVLCPLAHPQAELCALAAGARGVHGRRRGCCVTHALCANSSVFMSSSCLCFDRRRRLHHRSNVSFACMNAISVLTRRRRGSRRRVSVERAAHGS